MFFMSPTHFPQTLFSYSKCIFFIQMSQHFFKENYLLFYPLWKRLVHRPLAENHYNTAKALMLCQNLESYDAIMSHILLLSNSIVPCRWMLCGLLLWLGLQQSRAEPLSCRFLLPCRYTQAPGLHCRHLQHHHGQQSQRKLWSMSIRLLLSGWVILSARN